MSDVVVIREVTGYEPPKCDLNDAEMKRYLDEREQLYDDLDCLCYHFAQLRKYEDDHNIRWEENKATVAKVFCLALQMTSAAGTGNPLMEMHYGRNDRNDEIVTPILADGNADWYECHVTGDSGIAMIMDMVNQFVRKAW